MNSLTSNLGALGAICLFASMVACSPQHPPVLDRAGADRDAKGCTGSAGYTWSLVRGECIRVFEAGLAFEPDPVPTQGGVLAAFVVLAPPQGKVMAAEVFLPGRSSPIALTLVRTPTADGRFTVLENETEGIRVLGDKQAFVLEVPGQIYRRRSQPDDRLLDMR